MSKADSLILVGLILASFFTGGCGKASKAVAENRQPMPAEALSDDDKDGIPDAAELHSPDDRQNFRRWFAAIAEMQFYNLNPLWTEEQRDCAGLVRFAWREALRKHDRLWFQGMGATYGSYEPVAPDVKAISLERNPLGEKLFRTDFGVFAEGDLLTKFSEFADARTLKNYNSEFITRNRQQLNQLQSGDLLFFHQPWVQKFPYHVMIFLGEARQANEGANDWVVYHTGSSAEDEGEDKGEVKKVRLSVLDKHPNPRWRPIERNQNFLGFYRLKILS